MTDLRRKVTIVVTQNHIDRGLTRHCESCPIALAIDEQLPMPSAEVKPWFAVSPGSVVFYGADVSTDLPPEANKFISSFDAEGPVEPFSFDLNIPWILDNSTRTDTRNRIGG